MRWAFKLFYDGTEFHGSQIQPKLRTVQGELIKALDKLGYIKGEKNVSFCCRTDAGVSALSQVVVAELTRKPITGEINNILPKDMLIWASAEVSENVPARYLVEWKLYRYYLPLLEDVNINNIIKASELIKGRKELGGLSKGKKGGLIDEVKVSKSNDVLIMDFKGRYFSWNLVRRSVNALYMVGSGKLSIDQFMNILNNPKMGIHPAPSWGLILLDVGCKLKFTVDRRALRRLTLIITNLSLMMRSRATMLNDLRMVCNSLSE
jgi:tRNA pseudouridine38-40 synthase